MGGARYVTTSNETGWHRCNTARGLCRGQRAPRDTVAETVGEGNPKALKPDAVQESEQGTAKPSSQRGCLRGLERHGLADLLYEVQCFSGTVGMHGRGKVRDHKQ